MSPFNRAKHAPRVRGRLIRGILAATVLLVLLWLALSRGVGMGTVVRMALDRLPEGWDARVEAVQGDWRSRITLRQLHITSPGISVSVPELDVRYALAPLFRRTMRITRIDVVNPRVDIDLINYRRARVEKTQDRPPLDSWDALVETWGLGDILGQQPLGRWRVSVEAVEVTDAEGRIVVDDEHRPDVFLLSGGHALGRIDMGPGGTHVVLDSMVSHVTPPLDSATDEGSRPPGRFAIAGTLTDGVVNVEKLAYQTARSRVVGTGSLALLPPDRQMDRFDFELAATPLDLRDIPVKLPPRMRSDPELTVSLVTQGAADSVRVAGRVSGLVDGDATVVVRPFQGLSSPDPESLLQLDGGDRAALDATITLARADLSAWGEPPRDGTVDGRVELRLLRFARDSPLRIVGTARYLPDSLAAGLLRGPLRAGFHASRVSREENIEAKVTLSASSHAARWSEFGTVKATIGQDAATWIANVHLDSAGAAGEGSVTWDGDAPVVGVDDLTFENLNAARLDAEFPQTSVSGAATGGVTGIGGESPSGTLRLALRPSHFGKYSIDTLALDATLLAGRVDGSLLAEAFAKRLETVYRATVGQSEVIGDLTAFRLTSSTPAAGTDTVPEIDIQGRANGRWRRAESSRRGRIDLLLDSARVGRARAHGAAVTAEVTGGQVSATARLDVWDLVTGPVLVEANAEAEGATARELAGAIDVRMLRPHVTEDDLTGVGPADTVRLGGLVARADFVDSLVATVSFEDLNRYELNGTFRPAEAGRVALNGTARVSGEATVFDLRASGALAEPTEILRQAVVDSLDVAASGASRAGGGGPLAVSARLAATGARWKGLSVTTLQADLRSDSLGLALDTLIVNSNAALLRGSGKLPPGGERPGRIEVTATVLDVEPIRRTLGAEVLTSGRGELVLVATGTLDSIDVTTTGSAGAIAYEGLGLTGLELNGTARLEPPFTDHLGLTAGNLAVGLDRLVLPQAEVRRIDLNVSGGPDSLLLESSALVDDRRRGTLMAIVDPRPDRRTVRIEGLDLSLDRDRWTLSQPAVLSYGRGVSIETFLLRAGDQEIRIEGGIDEAGALDLSARIDSTDIGTLSDLMGFRGLQGWLAGNLRLTGAPRTPTGRVDLTGAFNRNGVAAHRARIAAELNGRRVSGIIVLNDTDGGELRLNGSGPLFTGGADTTSLDLTVMSEAFGLAWVLPFLDPNVVTRLRGRIDGTMTVGGTVAQPTFSGSMALSRAGMRIEPLGTAWSEVFGVVSGSGSDLAIDSMRIVSGSGTLTGRGVLSLTGELPLGFDLYLNGFQAIRNERYRSRVSGRLELAGTLERPLVNGRLFIRSLDIFLDERLADDGLEDVELTEADTRMLRERFGYVVQDRPMRQPLLDRLTADVLVDLSRDSWLRKRHGPEMAVAFTGSIEVRLQPGDEPALQGSVETIAGRGFVSQFGRRFAVREGTVTFDGPATSARLDLAAAYTIPSRDNPDDAEATIVLQVTGTQEALALELSSDPPMENADIVSYIATGRPASGTLPSSESRAEGGLVAAGTDLALGQIVGVIEGAAERSVGLDVVEVRREGVRGATLVVGKYVSPRLYVGFAQPVTIRDGDFSLGGNRESEVEIELEALRWLLLNLEGTASALRVFLRGRRAY